MVQILYIYRHRDQDCYDTELQIPNCLVEGGAEKLTVVFREVNTSDAFVMSFLKLPQALAC